MSNQRIVPHRLPEDPAGMGDADWFCRLNEFEQQETRRQALFKRAHWPKLPDGCRSGSRGYTYPHILPRGREHENFYPAIAKAAPQYLTDNDIALHSEAANLRSSQICCLNFLFPLRLNIDDAAPALRPLLPGMSRVEVIEFEYTGPPGTTAWLGEPPSGKRGQNRTSTDVAIWWRDDEGRRRVTLVEWKYTEKHCGDCGGLRSRGNHQKDKCRQWQSDCFDPAQDCYLAMGDTSRKRRRYWEHLAEAGINLNVYDGERCPFSGPPYQLMRLHLLARHISVEGCAERVDVAVVCFSANRSLARVPRHLRHLGSDMASVWRRLLYDRHAFRVCYAEDLAAAIRRSGIDPSVGVYLSKRYGV